MKKLYIAFVLLIPIVLPFTRVSAEFDFSSAWKQWVRSRQSISQTVETLTPVVEEKEISKSPYVFTRNTLIRRRVSVSSSDVSEATVQARLTPIRPRTDVHTITDEPLQLFKIGVKNTTQGSNTTFVEPLLLEEATFRLFANSGIAEDVQHLELNIDGQTSSFDTDGRVTVQFNNARLAQGESVDFDVFIQIKDPSTTPHIPGALRLRLDRMTAIGETSEKGVSVEPMGTVTSSKIVFDPVPTVTEGETSFSAGSTYLNIYGKTLSAGEEVFVLGADLFAYYDDLLLREITLKNILTGSDIDPFIDKVEAINLHTQEVIGTGRFSNGEVKLLLSPNPFIGRNQKMRIGFKVFVADRIPKSSLDARFKLDIAAENLFIESKTTGQELPDSRKSFSINSQEFAIAQGKIIVSNSAHQESFAVDTNNPETVYRFNITGGSSNMALGRISMEIFPSGCEFDDGSLDASDVQLVRINGSQQYIEAVNIATSGNKITFDFPRELFLSRNEKITFGVRLKLDDLPGNDEYDSIAVKMLGDSNYASGTLSSVRSTGSNFIWSDTSARLHSVLTEDWASGYLVSGLPSNTKVVKRFGN